MKGTIRRIGIEGGVWALIADDGSTIELIDPPAPLQEDGQRADVELDRKSTDASIGMLGGLARVRSFKVL